ncbi:hypothetical protein MUP79_08360 [Candidatus Bathyarchaeota archaeon]|nr:hypothetical protein [Candidatus Bathyarchaeota archaeon]
MTLQRQEDANSIARTTLPCVYVAFTTLRTGITSISIPCCPDSELEYSQNELRNQVWEFSSARPSRSDLGRKMVLVMKAIITLPTLESF